MQCVLYCRGVLIQEVLVSYLIIPDIILMEILTFQTRSLICEYLWIVIQWQYGGYRMTQQQLLS